MNEQTDIETIVRIVTGGLGDGTPDARIVQKLVAAGIPAADAVNILRAVKIACQQGVQSVITEGLSAPNGPPQDPLLAEAFRIGQESIRGAVRRVWLKRILTATAVVFGLFVLVTRVWHTVFFITGSFALVALGVCLMILAYGYSDPTSTLRR